MHEFKNGDRVTWQYTHATSSKTRFKRSKQGTYLGLVTYRPGGLYGPIAYDPRRALVAFDGNRRWSKVNIDELKLVTPDGEERSNE